MKPLLLSLFVIGSCIVGSWAAGAGRAFPLEAENYAIKSFQKINPSLEWDKTNFLVDLSGQYANCKQPKGQVKADRTTPDGATIYVFVDIVQGDKSDLESVDKYIREQVDRWVNSGTYSSQLRDAKRFGCSVRPACSGTAVIACVTTDDKGKGGNNGGRGDGDFGGNYQNGGKIERVTPQPYYTPHGGDEKEQPRGGLQGYNQKALAFTPQQYSEAESMLGSKWDRSHFLEDLSGFETDCAMIGKNDWPFDKMKNAARERNIKITTQFGNAPNKGSTPDALKEILRKFKPITSAKQVGCSIIPDCKGYQGMEVVIACLYEEA